MIAIHPTANSQETPLIRGLANQPMPAHFRAAYLDVSNRVQADAL
jgi:hypothetical protein